MRCFDPDTRASNRSQCCTNTETEPNGGDDYEEDYAGPEYGGEIDYGEVQYPDTCISEKFSETTTHYCEVYPDKRTSTQKSYLPCTRDCFGEDLRK